MSQSVREPGLPLYRFNVEDYQRMKEAGIFKEQRVELIDGQVIDKGQVSSFHKDTVMRLNHTLNDRLDDNYLLSIHKSLRIDNYSEPAPDVAILHHRVDYGHYRKAHPTPKDTLLIVEVAGASLEKIQKVKLSLYARAGIPEVWIVNLQKKQLEQYRKPSDKGFISRRILSRGEVVENALVGEMQVEEFFD